MQRSFGFCPVRIVYRYFIALWRNIFHAISPLIWRPLSCSLINFPVRNSEIHLVGNIVGIGKTELLEGGCFSSVEEARSETFSYIESYYNRIRKHSSLGYKSPEQFERQFENLKMKAAA